MNPPGRSRSRSTAADGKSRRRRKRSWITQTGEGLRRRSRVMFVGEYVMPDGTPAALRATALAGASRRSGFGLSDWRRGNHGRWQVAAPRRRSYLPWDRSHLDGRVWRGDGNSSDPSDGRSGQLRWFHRAVAPSDADRRHRCSRFPGRLHSACVEAAALAPIDRGSAHRQRRGLVQSLALYWRAARAVQDCRWSSRCAFSTRRRTRLSPLVRGSSAIMTGLAAGQRECLLPSTPTNPSG